MEPKEGEGELVVAEEPEPVDKYFRLEPPKEPTEHVVQEQVEKGAPKRRGESSKAQPKGRTEVPLRAPGPSRRSNLPLPFVRIPNKALMEPMRVVIEQIERDSRVMIVALKRVGLKLHSNNVARVPEFIEDLQVKLNVALAREPEAHQGIREQNRALQQLQGKEWTVLDRL